MIRQGMTVMAAFFALGAAASAVSAQEADQGQAPAAPCSSEEYRQFDFWAGEWDVFNPAGSQVGTNSITPLLGGCVLREHWEGAGGSIGESYNIYDRATGMWHQTWVDNGGLLLQLGGGLEDGAMVLRGELKGRDGVTRLHRVSWTPADDGSVRQHWESSADDGATWTTNFDGKYVKRDG